MAHYHADGFPTQLLPSDEVPTSYPDLLSPYTAVGGDSNIEHYYSSPGLNNIHNVEVNSSYGLEMLAPTGSGLVGNLYQSSGDINFLSPSHLHPTLEFDTREFTDPAFSYSSTPIPISSQPSGSSFTLDMIHPQEWSPLGGKASEMESRMEVANTYAHLGEQAQGCQTEAGQDYSMPLEDYSSLPHANANALAGCQYPDKEALDFEWWYNYVFAPQCHQSAHVQCNEPTFQQYEGILPQYDMDQKAYPPLSFSNMAESNTPSDFASSPVSPIDLSSPMTASPLASPFSLPNPPSQVSSSMKSRQMLIHQPRPIRSIPIISLTRLASASDNASLSPSAHSKQRQHTPPYHSYPSLQ